MGLVSWWQKVVSRPDDRLLTHQQRVKESPMDPQAHLRLAEAYLAAKKKEEAVGAFKTAAQLYANQGHLLRANVIVRRALVLAPRDEVLLSLQSEVADEKPLADGAYAVTQQELHLDGALLSRLQQMAPFAAPAVHATPGPTSTELLPFDMADERPDFAESLSQATTQPGLDFPSREEMEALAQRTQELALLLAHDLPIDPMEHAEPAGFSGEGESGRTILAALTQESEDPTAARPEAPTTVQLATIPLTSVQLNEVQLSHLQLNEAPAPTEARAERAEIDAVAAAVPEVPSEAMTVGDITHVTLTPPHAEVAAAPATDTGLEDVDLDNWKPVGVDVGLDPQLLMH